jgi:hypothetical protein
MANELNEARNSLKEKLYAGAFSFGVDAEDVVRAIERLIDACIDAERERSGER